MTTFQQIISDHVGGGEHALPKGTITSGSMKLFTRPAGAPPLTLIADPYTVLDFRRMPFVGHLDDVAIVLPQGARVLGAPQTDGSQRMLWSGGDFSNPVEDFDKMTTTEKNRSANRCRTGPDLAHTTNCAVIGARYHDSGSVEGADASTNASYIGLRVDHIGPSRDPLWHADSLGMIGGSSGFALRDSEMLNARIIFADSTGANIGKQGMAHRGFEVSNVWLSGSPSVPLVFTARAGDPARYGGSRGVFGTLDRVRFWGSKYLRVDNVRDDRTGEVDDRYWPGQSFNAQPARVNVTQTNVTQGAPTTGSPVLSWQSMDKLNLVRYLRAIA